MSKILVIEDDPQLRTFVAICLERGGHSAVVAQDGTVALKLLGEAIFDLVITDLFMPETDGLEVLSVLRKRFPAMPSIAMSGGAGTMNHDFLPAARALGAWHILAKPFTAADLLAKVNDALSATKPEAQAQVK